MSICILRFACRLLRSPESVIRRTPSFRYHLLNRLLNVFGLVLGPNLAISYLEGELPSVFRIEYDVHHLNVCLNTLINRHLQSTKHDGNQSSCAGSANHVEVITWFGAPNKGENLPQHVQGGKTTYTSSIKAEKSITSWYRHLRDAFRC